MENLSLTFCLVIVALLASVGSGFAFFNEPRDACIQNAQNALTQNYVLLGFWANEENSVFHTQIMQNGQKKQG